MAFTNGRKLVVAAGVLLIAAHYACPKPAVRAEVKDHQTFQDDMNALHAGAAKATTGTPDQVLIIGYTDIGGTKNLTYIPSELHISTKSANVSVGWISYDGAFTLQFYKSNTLAGGGETNWPFTEPEPQPSAPAGPDVISSTTNNPPPNSANMHVRKNSPPGKYHFRVTLMPDPNDHTKDIKDLDCPPIIVDE